MNSAATRRLVNCRTLVRKTNEFGRTYLAAFGGADGVPERALEMARRSASHTAANAFHGVEVLGIEITDVITGEKWAVAI